MHTKHEQEGWFKRLVRVSGGGAQKVESRRLKSRVVWLYYLDLEGEKHVFPEGLLEN